MARKPRVFIEGGIYHITCRGNDRRNIFKGMRTAFAFWSVWERVRKRTGFVLYLFCLMTNHVHLLAETPHGNLDRFMGSLLTGYTVYYNRRHNRSGHLMQGRYGAQVVEGTDYLLKLSRYIHLNPVHVKDWEDRALGERLNYLRSYPWSSFREYAGLANACGFLCPAPVLGLMEGLGRGRESVRYKRYVEAGLAKTDDQFWT
jgi:REP element-mobilizing transposase RayT